MSALLLVNCGGDLRSGQEGSVPDAGFGGVVVHSTALTGVALYELDPQGYNGTICIDGRGCASNGQVQRFDLAAGTYTLSAPYSYQIGAESTSLGTITVGTDASVTPTGVAVEYVTPVPASDPGVGCPTGEPEHCRIHTIRLRTIPVTVNLSGYAGQIYVYGGPLLEPTTRLLRARRYQMYSPFSHSSTGASTFSPTADLTVGTDDQLGAGDVLGLSLDVVGTSITARVLTATIDRQLYPGIVAVYAIGSPGDSVVLLQNRRYRIYAPYSHSPVDGSTFFSTEPDLQTTSTSLAFVPGTPLSQSFYFGPVPNPTTLYAAVTPVTLDRQNYQGLLDLYGIGALDGIRLLNNRRYRLQARYSHGTDTSFGGSFSPGPDLHVGTNSLSRPIEHAATVDPSFDIGIITPATGQPTTIRARVSTAEYVRNGYVGPFEAYGVASALTPGPDLPPTITLLRGRSYRAQVRYSYSASNDFFFGTEPDIQVDADGNYAPIGEPIQASFNISGAMIAARVGVLTVGRNGYPGTISSWLQDTPAPSNFVFNALLGRSVQLRPSHTYVNFPTSGPCVPDYIEGTSGSTTYVMPVTCGPPTTSAGLYPLLSCVLASGDDRVAIFGYRNEGSTGVAVPVSASFNGVSPGAAHRGQPTWFLPPTSSAPTQPVAFAVVFPATGTATWTLGMRNVTATGASFGSCTLTQGAGGTSITYEGRNYHIGTEGSACPVGENCTGQVVCTPGPSDVPVCQGGTACSPTTCDSASGTCSSLIANAGKPCEDGNPCTVVDSCDGNGTCVGGEPKWCDDENPCTVDSCNLGGTCVSREVCTPASDPVELSSIALRVVDDSEQPLADVQVTAYRDTVAVAYARTDRDGLARFGLAFDSYHFGALVGGEEVLSGAPGHCAAGYCNSLKIVALPSGPRPCATPEQCRALASQGSRLHLFATNTSGQDVYHAIRERGSFGFFQVFTSIMASTGRPWEEAGRVTEIIDLAAQSSGRDVHLLVLVRSRPSNGDGDDELSLWFADWRLTGWTSFSRFHPGSALQFQSIDMSGGKDGMTFCGSTTDGGIYVADRHAGAAMWGAVIDVKSLALSDPGPASSVVCQRQFSGLPLVVLADVGGSLQATFVNGSRTLSTQNDWRWSLFIAPVPGWSNWSTRFLLSPLPNQDMALRGIPEIGDLHVVMGNGTLRAQTRFFTEVNWSGLAGLATVGQFARSALVAAEGQMHVLQSTPSGSLRMGVLDSASGAWSEEWLTGTTLGGMGGFADLAGTEVTNVPHPIRIIPELTRQGSDVVIRFADSSDFEEGYRIYLGETRIASIAAIPGGPPTNGPGFGEWRISNSELEPGRRYHFEIVAYNDNGESPRAAAFPDYIGVARIKLSYDKYNSSCFWIFCGQRRWVFSYEMLGTSVGPADPGGTAAVRLELGLESDALPRAERRLSANPRGSWDISEDELMDLMGLSRSLPRPTVRLNGLAIGPAPEEFSLRAVEDILVPGLSGQGTASGEHSLLNPAPGQPPIGCCFDGLKNVGEE